MSSDTIALFSSHAWSYLRRREGLHDLLAPTWVKGRDFYDLSSTPRHPIDFDSEPELAAALKARIRASDALLVIAGMYLNNRPWMQFEVTVAYALDVPIIPILFNGQERVPRAATRLAACEPVRWRGDSVREAVLSFLPEHRRAAFEERRKREFARRLAEAMAQINPQPNALLPRRTCFVDAITNTEPSSFLTLALELQRANGGVMNALARRRPSS